MIKLRMIGFGILYELWGKSNHLWIGYYRVTLVAVMGMVKR